MKKSKKSKGASDIDVQTLPAWKIYFSERMDLTGRTRGPAIPVHGEPAVVVTKGKRKTKRRPKRS